MIFKAVRTVFGDLLEGVTEFFIGKRIALGKQVAKIAQDLLDGLDIALVAVNEQLIAARADIHIEQRFEIFDVLILNAEKRVESLGW